MYYGGQTEGVRNAEGTVGNVVIHTTGWEAGEKHMSIALWQDGSTKRLGGPSFREKTGGLERGLDDGRGL